jgi:hypothetical protein
MSISYGELAIIGAMKDRELKAEYRKQGEKKMRMDEDTEDTINAILQEMERRGLPHP